MSQEQTNIVLGGSGVHSRRNVWNADKATVFYNFLKVLQGHLASIVGVAVLQVILKYISM